MVPDADATGVSDGESVSCDNLTSSCLGASAKEMRLERCVASCIDDRCVNVGDSISLMETRRASVGSIDSQTRTSPPLGAQLVDDSMGFLAPCIDDRRG